MSLNKSEKPMETKFTEDGLDPYSTVPAQDNAFLSLVAKAQQADEADQALTFRQAMLKYRKAFAWSMVLSMALVMDGFYALIISAFYGQTQFKEKFGAVLAPGTPKAISAAWQSGLSNGGTVGGIIGLSITSWSADRFGTRRTMIFFFGWLICVIVVSVVAINLPMLLAGNILASIGTGAFQTLTTTYASEVVPTILRPYTTAWVCIAWGIGLTISSGVLRACLSIPGDLSWRLPFILQWIYPPILLVAAYFAPESPWNAVRRGKVDEAKAALKRLMTNPTEEEVVARLAYIEHTTAVENAEGSKATFLACFQGTNLRRTEINCMTWAIQILCGNAILGYAVVFLEGAGFSETQAFDLNIGLEACQIAGGFLSWYLMAHLGRATLYIGGQAFMFFCLLGIGILGFVSQTKPVSLAIGLLLLISTFCNLTTTGPVCYPIVGETPSGPLRNKTIVIGRIIYLCTSIFSNIVTPRMLSPTAWNWMAKCGLFYAGTNLICNIWCWFRLPETKGRSFGEIDILFENRVPARKFKYTKVDEFNRRLGDPKDVVGVPDEDAVKVAAVHAETIA